LNNIILNTILDSSTCIFSHFNTIKHMSSSWIYQIKHPPNFDAQLVESMALRNQEFPHSFHANFIQLTHIFTSQTTYYNRFNKEKPQSPPLFPLFLIIWSAISYLIIHIFSLINLHDFMHPITFKRWINSILTINTFLPIQI
jgi:hypothetical protein